jgi:multidrug efflux pump subunit AcrA (membrane-fusion protein)
MKIRKLIVFVIVVLLLGVIFSVGSVSYEYGVSYGESHAEEIRSSKTKEAESVTSKKFASVVYLKNDTVPIKVNGSGRVIPGTIINISSEVQGVLNSVIDLKKGVSFKKGEVLFKISDTDAKLLLAARKSGYLSALTQILPDIATDFPDEFEKWNNFFNSINVNQSLSSFPSFESAREKNFIISRNILGEFLNIKSDEFKLSKFQQISPFNGSVVDAFSDQGAIVNPGSPVIKVMRSDELEIEIPIPIKHINQIKIGNHVDLFENKNIDFGKVVRIGEFINPNTQSVPVYVKPNKGHNLYYGMYVQAEIKFKSTELVAKIPRKAVFGKNKIYMLNSDSSIQSININIRSKDDTHFFINGLKDSTIIVSQPLINVKDSLKVIPIFQ